jgi:hypothetical protein
VDPTVLAKIIPIFAVAGGLFIVSALLPSRSRASGVASRWSEAPTARLWGTGVGLLDYRPAGLGEYEATRWFTVLYVPLIPGPTWVIRPRGAGSTIVVPPMLTVHSFDRVAERDTPKARIARTYALGVISACAGFGPAALAMWAYDHLPQNVALLAIVASIAPPLAILWYLNGREENVYRGGGPGAAPS